MDARERLARHLYPSALDLSPEGVIALRIGHFGGLEWEIADDTLSVQVGDEGLTFDLTALTIGELSEALGDAGFEIRYANDDVLARSAACLVAGKGGGDNDRLVAFQSNLWALLDAYGVEIRDAELNLAEAIKQLDLRTSDGEFLDFWGEFFASPRLPAETDAAYRARMPAEVLRPRSNPIAIQNAIRDQTGHLVSLREPWREIFTLNVSAMSDRHCFQDGAFFTWNVFQPIYHSNVTPAERAAILAIIERNRPAGNIMVGEFAEPPIAYAVWSAPRSCSATLLLTYNSGLLHYRQDVLSSSLALSDGLQDFTSEMIWTLSGTLIVNAELNPLNLFAVSGWDDRVWGSFVWRQASISAVVTQSSV